MRPRSPTNSNPHKDVALRREYLAENPYCELSPWLSKHVRELGLEKVETACEVHHIFGGSRSRWDVFFNMISVCRIAHDWCGRNPTDQRVLCLYVKMRNCELDLDAFQECTGMRLEGWLMIYVPTHPALLACHAELSAFAKGST